MKSAITPEAISKIGFWFKIAAPTKILEKKTFLRWLRKRR